MEDAYIIAERGEVEVVRGEELSDRSIASFEFGVDAEEVRAGRLQTMNVEAAVQT